MTTTRTQPDSPTARSFWRHAGGLSVIGVIVALVLGAAFMSVGHDQRPRDVPIAAVGPASVAQALEAKAPDQLSATAVADRAAAVREIERRDVYGAVVAGPEGVRELMIAPAANNGVANFLRRTLGEPTSAGAPQISGAGTARELLPPFWGDVGHYLPGGAGTSLLRDVFYFPEASSGEPIAILAGYATVGLLVLVGLSLARSRTAAPSRLGATAVPAGPGPSTAG